MSPIDNAPASQFIPQKAKQSAQRTERALRISVTRGLSAVLSETRSFYGATNAISSPAEETSLQPLLLELLDRIGSAHKDVAALRGVSGVSEEGISVAESVESALELTEMSLCSAIATPRYDEFV